MRARQALLLDDTPPKDSLHGAIVLGNIDAALNDGTRLGFVYSAGAPVRFPANHD